MCSLLRAMRTREATPRASTRSSAIVIGRIRSDPQCASVPSIHDVARHGAQPSSTHAPTTATMTILWTPIAITSSLQHQCCPPCNRRFYLRRARPMAMLTSTTLVGRLAPVHAPPQIRCVALGTMQMCNGIVAVPFVARSLRLTGADQTVCSQVGSYNGFAGIPTACTPLIFIHMTPFLLLVQPISPSVCGRHPRVVRIAHRAPRCMASRKSNSAIEAKALQKYGFGPL